ncbi:MAG: hypothetical protein ABIK26_08675 [Candidatus Omnitrophota bacterium]
MLRFDRYGGIILEIINEIRENYQPEKVILLVLMLGVNPQKKGS